MKNIQLIIFLILCWTKADAQFTDLYWNLGKGTALDFKTTPSTVIVNDSIGYTLSTTSTSVCDRNGNVIFCTNALRVINKNGHVMPNGSGINLGTFINSYAVNGNFNPIFKGAVSIPFTNDTNKFYVFYVNMEWQIGAQYLPDKLYYLIVDKTLDNGLGDVTTKDQVLIQNDTLSLGELMAIKHGNGKDWWMLCRKYRSNVYYKFLIDSAGIHQQTPQSIGVAFYDSINTYDYICNSSLDGENLAYIKLGDTYNGHMDLLNFDRCTGALYNYKKVELINPSKFNFAVRSCCFSPNKRYLYVTDMDSIWQLDLTATNIKDSKILLGYRHGVSQFFIMKNAPDGKIYIGPYGGFEYMHVINDPDSFGIACNFVENAIQFGNHTTGPWVGGGIPNVPNFNLGKLNCAIGIEEQSTTFGNQLLVYPNPATDQLTVSSNQYIINSIEVTNLLGQKISFDRLRMTGHGELVEPYQLSTENLPSGIYFLKATDNKGNVSVGKFVKE